MMYHTDKYKGYEIIHLKPDTPSQYPPIVFVHGAWHAAWCWNVHFLPYFVEHGFEVLAFSLRGHGNSHTHKPLAITRIADYVDDLCIILARFETAPFLIAHSMGALVTLKLLEQRHDIPGAVLLAPLPIHGNGRLAWRVATKRPLLGLHILRTWDVYRLISEPDEFGNHFFSPHMSPDEAEMYRQRFTKESFVAVAIDGIFLNLARPARIKTPLLFFGGRHDRLFRPEEICQTAQSFGTQAQIISTMGHELMLDPGWETVADQIIKWISILKVENEMGV